MLCAWIGHASEKLWPFEFLESFSCSISSVSICYVPESDIRVKSYDHLNFSRTFVVQFRASRYGMRLNRTCEWKVMAILISRELPLYNFRRIGHPREKLWPFEYPISSIVLCIQSLNNIWMMSIRKCSIREIRWCFFFKPRSVIFPGRRQLAFFPITIGESCMCFCRGWLMFSLPSKWKHAGVGQNTTSVELERKNLADLHCKFWRQHRTKKHPLP